MFGSRATTSVIRILACANKCDQLAANRRVQRIFSLKPNNENQATVLTNTQSHVCGTTLGNGTLDVNC